MNVPCKGCGGQTKPKNITTSRGPAVVYECIGSCTNEKGYKLGTFAPRAPKVSGPQNSDALLTEVRLIRVALERIAGLKSEPLERATREATGQREPF